jgi:hypothetical protein
MTMRRLVLAVSLIAALPLAGPLRAEQAAAPASGNEESNPQLTKKTANWEAAKGNQWTVPLGLGGGKLFRLRELPGGDNLGELGKLPMNVSLDAYANAVRPDFAANWQLRFQIQFLFPK